MKYDEVEILKPEAGEIMSSVLIIVDMQKFVDDRISKGVDTYPDNAIHNMNHILKKFRRSGNQVVHVHHHSLEEGASLHRNSLLAKVVTGFEEEPGEPVFIKNTSSAFSSTDLYFYLKKHEFSECIVIGAVAGFCINSTVRAGSDLGFKMTVVDDAVISFGLEDCSISAKVILDVTLALLKADFAKVVATKDLTHYFC